MNIIKKKYILFKMEKNSDENGDCKKYFHSVCVFLNASRWLMLHQGYTA